MRFTPFTVFAAFSCLAMAQNLLDNIPPCAQKCYSQNTGNCNAINIPCICGNSTLIDGLSCCVSQNCNAQEQNATIAFAVNLCQANGNNQVPTQAGCSSSTPTPTPDASPAATSTSTGAAAIHTGLGVGLGLGMAGLLAAL